MKELHFKKIQGGIYRIRFYVGEFYVPVEEGLLKELKKQANGSPEEFMRVIQEKMGFNTYLKTTIQEVLNRSNDLDLAAQAKSLMAEIQSL